MRPSSFLSSVINIAFFATSAFTWKCEPHSWNDQQQYFPVEGFFERDWCKVTNFSEHLLTPPNANSLENKTIPRLLLVDFQSSIEPWMENHFKPVDELYISQANVSSLYILPTLRMLLVRISELKEIVVNPAKTYLLEVVHFSETEFTMPSNLSTLKQLKTVQVYDSNCPVLNFSTFVGLIGLNVIRYINTQLSSVIISSEINLPSLHLLTLKLNKLQSIPENINHLNGLQIIELQWNEIAHIDMTAFNGMNNLRRLYLDGNPIATVTPDCIIHLPMLEYFDLSGKLMKKFNVSIITDEMLDD